MKFTRRGLLAAGAATVTSSALAQVAPGARQGTLAALRRAIAASAQTAITDKAAPGLSVAVAQRGRLLLSDGFGLANLETGTPVSAHGVFRIGSLTKQFTAAAVVRLSEQGLLRLSDRLGQHLPSFNRHPMVTLGELMHHTAGLHGDDESVSCSAGPDGPSSQTALADAIARQEKVFDFAPGSAWLYSNANYIALGAVVEQVVKRPLASALQDMLFKRLGPTSLALDRSDAIVPFRVSGYSHGADGYTNAPYLEISDAGGAGAMRSSAADLVRWHQALVGGRIVGGKGLQLLLTPGRLRDGRLSSQNRFSPDDATYGKVQYGGGLLLSPEGEHPRTISHNGFINGFSAVLETNLDSGVSFAVLTNADVGPKLPFRSIRRAVRAFEQPA